MKLLLELTETLFNLVFGTLAVTAGCVQIIIFGILFLLPFLCILSIF